MTAAKQLYIHGSIESLFEEIVAVWETIALAAYFSKDRFNTLAEPGGTAAGVPGVRDTTATV